MPNYLRIIGKNRKEALNKIEQQLGHKNISILREGNIVNKKKRWFRTIEEKVYYIECVEYRKIYDIVKDSRTSLNNEEMNDEVVFTPSQRALKALSDNKQKNELNTLNPAKQFSFQSDLRELTAKKPRPTSITENTKLNNNPLTELVNKITKNEQTNQIKNIRNNSSQFTDIQKDINNSRIHDFDFEYFNSPLTSNSVKEKLSTSQEHKTVYNFLIAREFTPKFSQKICAYFDFNILHNTESYQRLAEHIASFFTFTGIVEVKKEQANFVFLVGPTGVGKTTTLSKIASSFYTDEEHYPKPALIKFGSLDAKRIMAMEQLRKFANILRVPFKSIYGVNDFKELYKNSKKKELILIDTSGVSKQDTDLIDEIAIFTNSIKSSKEIHLSISAQSRYLDLKKTYQVLAKTKPSRVIITKIDESYSLGSILSFVEEVDLPISYITNGQDVPIDIITANKEKIKHILLREWGL